jgi:hypothetical protein
MMKTMWSIVTLALASMSATVAAEGDCSNYGVQQQVSVTGDNEISCVYQYCAGGPSGAGAAGVGVGTANGNGEAGASAAAGTECEQDAGEPASNEPEGPAARAMRTLATGTKAR